MALSWLPDGSERSLRSALGIVAPELPSPSIVTLGRVEESDPMWSSSSALVDGTFIVKYAWGEPAALRLYREVCVLDALRAFASELLLPPVAFSSTDPLLLATRKVDGQPLAYDFAHSLDAGGVERVGDQLGRFLAALHAPSVLEAARSAAVPLGGPAPQGDPSVLRERFPSVVSGRRRNDVLVWCDWVEATLAGAAAEVLVQGDLHVHNELWDLDTLTLRAVVDYETAAAADPAYDFRYLPRELDIFVAARRAYEQVAGYELDLPRVMAWFILTSLGDALWRAEAGVPMPAGGSTPDEWFDLVADRLSRLGVGPG